MDKMSSSSSQVLEHGNRAEILEMLWREMNLKYSNDDGDTVYHAILKNKTLTEEEIIEISRILRDRGINPNARNKKAEGALHVAIDRRMKNVADFFIGCRKPRSEKLKPSHTFTMFFVENEHKRLWQNYDIYNSEYLTNEKMESDSIHFLEWLISKEYDFDRKSKLGTSSLDIAISYNLQHILPVLLRHASNKNFTDREFASLLDNFVFRTIADRKRHVYKSKHWYSSYTLRYTGEIFKILLNRGAANIVNGRSIPVCPIIKEREDEMINILVDCFPYHCDPGKSFATNLLRELIEKYDCTNLSDSKIDWYLQILRNLVAKGAEVDKTGEHKMNPVQLAVTAKNFIAVIWLEEIGSDFSVLTKDAKNLLHLLASVKSCNDVQEIAMFYFLIGKGCPVNAKDENGFSPLHLAVKFGNSTLVKKLIEFGAKVNSKDKNMQSALHYAVMNDKNLELVELLLENGANVNAKDNDGNRPLALAACSWLCTGGRMIKVLLKWGAQVNALNESKDYKFYNNNMDEALFKEVIELYGLDVPTFYNRFSKHFYSTFSSILERHLIGLDAANFPCPKDYPVYDLQRNKRELLFRDTCLKEIDILKTTFIDNHISIYNLLHMNLNRRSFYINNDKYKNLVDSPVLKKQFPVYSVFIVASYREAVVRKSLLEPAKESWGNLTEIILPDICIEHIFSYLSNIDLVDLIEVD